MQTGVSKVKWDHPVEDQVGPGIPAVSGGAMCGPSPTVLVSGSSSEAPR
jgi:hypothetical protein